MAQVALSYHGSNPDKVIRAIEALGQKPYSQKVDALDMAAVRAFATSSAEQTGKKIAVLINVVGGLVARKRMEEMDDAVWDYVMTLNTKSIFPMTEAALPQMTDGGGRPLKLTSVDCVTANHWQGAFDAVTHLISIGHRDIVSSAYHRKTDCRFVVTEATLLRWNKPALRFATSIR